MSEGGIQSTVSSLISTHRRLLIRLGIGIGILVFGVLLFSLIRSLVSGDTYVRIIDTSNTDTYNGPSPGADIKGVGIVKAKTGKMIFASTVSSSKILPGQKEGQNTFIDASQALGDPEKKEEDAYVALGGLGGELILTVPTKLQAGDVLTVYEIGAPTGPRAEPVEIFTSKKPSGPWKKQGSGAGPLTITIQ